MDKSNQNILVPDDHSVEEKQILPILFCVYLTFVFIRFLFAVCFRGPWIMDDELQYKTVAFLIHKFGKINSGIIDAFAGPGFPRLDLTNVLYPTIISLSFYFKKDFNVVIKLLNSIMMNLSLFPIYLMMREFVKPKTAIFGAALCLLMPSFNFIELVMTENLFLPLYLFSFYFGYKVLVNAKTQDVLILALCLLLAFFTKPHIIVFIAAYLLILTLDIIYWEDDSARKKKLILFFVALPLILVGCIKMLTPSVNGSAATLGIYSDVLEKIAALRSIDVTQFMRMFIANVSSVLYLYLLPLLVTIWALLNFLENKKKYHGQIIFLAMVIGSLAAFFIMTNMYAGLINYYEKINARLYFYAFPLLFSSFLMFFTSIRLDRKKRFLLFFLFGAVLLETILVTYRQYGAMMLIFSNMDFSWVAYFKPAILIAAVSLTSLTICYYAFIRETTAYPYVVLFALMAIVANYGQIKLSRGYENYLDDNASPARALLENNKMVNNVMVIDDGMQGAFNVIYWNEIHYSKIAFWPPKGSRISSDMVPDGTDWLLLFGQYIVDIPTSAITFKKDGCTLICLKGIDVSEQVTGLSKNGWTEKEIVYKPEIVYDKLSIVVSQQEPSYPNKVTVILDGKKQRQIDLTKNHATTIDLPFAKQNKLIFHREIVPKQMNINEDPNKQGVHIESVTIS